MTDLKRSNEPHDRLTRICGGMIEALEQHPEGGDDVRAILFLKDEDNGGISMHGYENDMEAVADVFVHMRIIFQANGKDLFFAPLHGGADS